MKSRKNSERIAMQTLFSQFKNTADDPIEIGFHEQFQNIDTDSEDREPDMKTVSLKNQKKANLEDDQSDFENTDSDSDSDTKISPVKKQKKPKPKDGHVGKTKKRNANQSGKEVLLLKEQKKRKGKKHDVNMVNDAKLGIKRKRGNTKTGIVKAEKNKSKVIKEKKWLGIRTRSSPKQLFKAIILLKKKQREAVMSMGFGKLLSFKVDGIPAKLGHYVVDMFDDENMEIRLPNGTIKVDSESVHRLLGIPNSGIDLESVNPTRNLEPTVACWRNMYTNSFISASEIVTRLVASDDDDSFLFKLDFIILFLSTMVDCHTNGKCKLEILHSLSGETDFSKIDWCSYVVRLIKHCKAGWDRCSPYSLFRGALTILTLLYVDSVACPGMNVDRKVSSIEFWSMEMLKLRETLEIKNGGFGLGEIKGLYADPMYLDKEEFEVKEDLKKDDDSDDFLDRISKLEQMFDQIVKEKCQFEKALGMMYAKDPENEEIKILVQKYESMFKEQPIWAQSCTEEPSKRTDVPDTSTAMISLGSAKDYGDEGARNMDVLDKVKEDDERMDLDVLNQLRSQECEPLKESAFVKPGMDVKKTNGDSH